MASPAASPAAPALRWKPDWPHARRALAGWWEGRGLALHVTAPKDEPWEAIPPPPRACPEHQRLDAEWRLWSELHRMAHTFHGGVAFPQFNTDVGGPGSLGLFLGAGARIDDRTVWYDPCIAEPDAQPPLRFDPASWWWRKHVEVIDTALAAAGGRYLVGCPDLIENLDTLAQLRGSQEVLMDLLERPDEVEPLLDAVGPEGLFIMTEAATEEEARSLLRRTGWPGEA